MISSIKPSQIHYVGLRDIDSVEQDKIVQDHIYAPLTLNISHLVKTLKKKKIKHLYLHFDLDCLDPKAFNQTYYNVSNGLSIKEVEDCLMELKAKFKVEPIKHIINLIMYD